MSQDKEIQHVLAVFKVICKTNYGESIYLLGNIKELHSWSIEKPIKLYSIHYTAEDPIWETEELYLPANTNIQYKFFKKDSKGKISWEWTPDREDRQLYFNTGKQIDILQTFGISHKEIIIRSNTISLEETKSEGLLSPTYHNVKVGIKI